MIGEKEEVLVLSRTKVTVDHVGHSQQQDALNPPTQSIMAIISIFLNSSSLIVLKIMITTDVTVVSLHMLLNTLGKKISLTIDIYYVIYYAINNEILIVAPSAASKRNKITNITQSKVNVISTKN